MRFQISDLRFEIDQAFRFLSSWLPLPFANFASPLRSLRLRSCLKTQRSRSETSQSPQRLASRISNFRFEPLVCRRRRGREIIAQGKAVAATTLGYRGQNNLGACGARDRDMSAASRLREFVCRRHPRRKRRGYAKPLAAEPPPRLVLGQGSTA